MVRLTLAAGHAGRLELLGHLNHLHGGANQRGDLGHVAGNNQCGGGVRCHLGIGSYSLFGYLELHGQFPTGLADCSGNAFNGLGVGFGYRQNRGRLALRVVDGGLFLTFRAGNEGFAFTCSNVDLFLAASF